MLSFNVVMVTNVGGFTVRGFNKNNAWSPLAARVTFRLLIGDQLETILESGERKKREEVSMYYI